MIALVFGFSLGCGCAYALGTAALRCILGAMVRNSYNVTSARPK